jgi:hypothetical protein
MSLSIHIQIVGLFVSHTVKLKQPTATVKDALDQLKNDSTNGIITTPEGYAFTKFNYEPISAPGPKVFLRSFEVTQTRNFISRRTGAHYPAGQYKLDTAEISKDLEKAHAVWQYYILDRAKRDKPVVNASSFTQYHVHDGEHVIWRQIVVLKPEGVGPGKDAVAISAATAKVS